MFRRIVKSNTGLYWGRISGVENVFLMSAYEFLDITLKPEAKIVDTPSDVYKFRYL